MLPASSTPTPGLSNQATGVAVWGLKCLKKVRTPPFPFLTWYLPYPSHPSPTCSCHCLCCPGGEGSSQAIPAGLHRHWAQPRTAAEAAAVGVSPYLHLLPGGEDTGGSGREDEAGYPLPPLLLLSQAEPNPWSSLAGVEWDLQLPLGQWQWQAEGRKRIWFWAWREMEEEKF